MPAVNPNNASQAGPPQRTTFRPPWVKDGPTSLPLPTAPWTARGREAMAAATVSGASASADQQVERPAPRKLSRVTIIPSQPLDNSAQNQQSLALLSNLQPQTTPGKNQNSSERVVKPRGKIVKDVGLLFTQATTKSTTNPDDKEGQKQLATATATATTTTIPVAVESKSTVAAELPIGREPEKQSSKDSQEFTKPIEKELPKSILKPLTKSPVPTAPKPPPAPPMAPPLPPPSPGKATTPVIESKMTAVRAARIEALRSRPRRRPDWTDMMKEVENGRKLNHVVCNDRSAPILPQANVKGQFVYESEKDVGQAPHKQLLNQIQSGVKLKQVKCNDRSKPNLDGLRKFRRQMTIEEQIQKSMSMADVVALAAEPDELDDIDKVRDDLQSTKQMLAQELRNKEALERENKRMMARLLNLEVELDKEKNSKQNERQSGAVAQARSTTATDVKLVQQLKEEATDANRVAKEMEDKYHVTAEELDVTRAKLESAWLRNQQLELELKAKGGGSSMPISKQMSSKKLAAATLPNGKTGPLSDDESEYTELTETETESEDEDNEADASAVQDRRVTRELKLLATKLRSYKDKQAAALKERHHLREKLRKQQKTLRQERTKYKALQKEVDKMAKLMKDDEDDEQEEEQEEEDKPEEGHTEEETESESETEESEDEDPTDGDLPEDASVEEKRKNLTDRSKHHENRLGTLKKGNYLLKANIDRLQDDINRQREMSLSLQEDLNSVLAELG